MDASELLRPWRVVPVVVIDDPDAAVPLAETLLDAGIGVIEITLRTADALDAIANVAREVPGMLTGAGSVRNVQQLEVVAAAGASFAVSPGATPTLLDAARAANMPLVPGAATPSEMLAMLEYGYHLQKFFPAEAAGGIPFLKSVAGPIPDVSFMPTGGITPASAPDYLALPNVAGIGGSWIAPAGLLRERDFDAIAELAADAAALGV